MVCQENHPPYRLLRDPLRTRFDREAVRLRRQCPPARDLGEDDQETSVPSRQDFCRQELHGRNGEAVVGILRAAPRSPDWIKVRPEPPPRSRGSRSHSHDHRIRDICNLRLPSRRSCPCSCRAAWTAKATAAHRSTKFYYRMATSIG